MTEGNDITASGVDQARSLIAERRFGEAQSLVEDVLARDAGNADALRLAADLALRRSEPDAALAFLDSISPPAVDVHLSCAAILARMERHDESLERARAALELDASNPGALAHMAGHALRRGDAPDALELIERVASDDPRQACRAESIRAHALDAMGRFEEAFIAGARAATASGRVPVPEGAPDEGSLATVRALHRTAAIGRETFKDWARSPSDSLPRPRVALLLGPTLGGCDAIGRALSAQTDITTCRSRAPIARLAEAAESIAGGASDVATIGALPPGEIARLRSVFFDALAKEAGESPVIALHIDLPSFPTALVRRVIPEATLVMGVRDPRDVFLGCFFTEAQRFPTIYGTARDTAAVTFASYMTLQRLRDWTGFESVVVGYEPFSNDPGAALAPVFEALGVGQSAPIDSNDGEPRPGISWEPSTPDPRVCGRWRDYAPWFKRSYMELTPAMDAFGYDPGDLPRVDHQKVGDIARRSQGALSGESQPESKPNQVLADQLLREVLVHDPDHVVSLHLLSRLVQGRGRAHESSTLIDRACALEPGNPTLWVAAGENHIVEGNAAAAFTCYERATQVDPFMPEAWAGLASVYERMHDFDNAKRCADRAFKLAPQDASARLVKGRLARRDGDLQGARWTVEAVANDTSASDTMRSTALYELALIYDKLKSHENAFKAARAANGIVAQSPAFQRVDKNIIPLTVRQLAEVTSEEYSAWKDECEREGLTGDGPTPTFLVGMPRSGTTMSGQILEAHPDVLTIDERPMLAEAIGPLLATGKPLLDVLRTATVDQVRGLRQRFRTALRREAGVDENDTRVIVDKSPLLLAHLGAISRFFPDAKVFVAIRDPRDTLVSSFMQGFNVNAGMVHFLNQRWAANLQNAVLGGYLDTKDRFGLETMDVRYEALTESFEEHARAMIGFLGLPWHDSVLSFHQNKPRQIVLTPSYEAITKPVHAGAVARWKRYKEPFATSFEALAPLLERLGYEPTDPA